LLLRNFQRIAGGALLFFSSWWGGSLFFEQKALPPDGLEGVLYFSIAHVKPLQTPFGSVLSYQGEAKGFLTNKKDIPSVTRRISCQIIMKETKKRPQAVCDYLIHGRLLQKKKNGYIFKPTRNISWQPIEGSYSFAEWRFQCKRKIASFIKSRFHDTPCSALFASLATGDIDERIMAIEFGRLGLSHILAISGFHFALLAGFLGFCLQWLLPFRCAQFAVLFLTSGYFFFLGPTPSVIARFARLQSSSLENWHLRSMALL
jgi:competence protein ComEC